MTKKMISRRTDAYINFDYDTLADVARQIKELTETYGVDAYFSHQQEDYSDNYTCYLMIKSEETDDEYAERMRREKDSLAWRMEQYESLKKEFEGNP
jgi:hypothetical protein|tara:strand:+ start:71 stop:361 length:291 start_codon:yes stop_codon:yes gene_type:complete